MGFRPMNNKLRENKMKLFKYRPRTKAGPSGQLPEARPSEDGIQPEMVNVFRGLKKKLAQDAALEVLEEGLTPELVRKAARGGQRQFDLTLIYDPSRISGYSQLLMECIASRGIIPASFDMHRAVGLCRSLGKLPARVLAGDEDRWQLYIFAYEYVRLFGDKEHKDAANWDCKPLDFDAEAEAIKQDGRTWGGVDLPDGTTVEPIGDSGLSHSVVKPVREQVQERREAEIEAHKKSLVPVDLDKVRESASDPYIQKWEIAQGLARKKRVEWEGKLDFEMEQMVRYCYGWIRDIGVVPEYPADLQDLFWPVPRPEMSERAIQRRNQVTEKLVNFWRNSVAQNGEGMDVHSESYRIVLAARELESLVEEYATNFRKVGQQDPNDPENKLMTLEQIDKVTNAKLRNAAVRYFQAHFPVHSQGAPAGPIETLDPTYVEYVRLCRKYGLVEGTLLHEANI